MSSSNFHSVLLRNQMKPIEKHPLLWIFVTFKTSPCSFLLPSNVTNPPIHRGVWQNNTTPLVSSHCLVPALFLLFLPAENFLCRHSRAARAALWNKALIGWCPPVVTLLSLNQSPKQLLSLALFLFGLLLSSMPLCSFLLKPVRPVGLVVLIVGKGELNFFSFIFQIGQCRKCECTRQRYQCKTAADFWSFLFFFSFKETLWYIPRLKHMSGGLSREWMRHLNPCCVGVNQ